MNDIFYIVWYYYQHTCTHICEKKTFNQFWEWSKYLMESLMINFPVSLTLFSNFLIETRSKCDLQHAQRTQSTQNQFSQFSKFIWNPAHDYTATERDLSLSFAQPLAAPSQMPSNLFDIFLEIWSISGIITTIKLSAKLFQKI